MPRKKKNGQSPARAPSGGPLEEGGSLGHNNTAYGLPQRGLDGASMTASQTSSSVVKSMQEMFSHLDPEVIYIVLSECDFKVEHAMDSLLELSVAAEVAAPTPSHVSGFERTAAALLSPCHFTEPRLDPDSNESSSPSTDLLTDELDLLVDQELETLTAHHSVKDEHHQYLSVGSSLSSLPPPPLPQQVLPELLQSSLQPGPKGPSGGGQAERTPGASSPLNQLSRWGENVVDERRDERQSASDFSHLITEADKPTLDLANSGRPSAFQVYKKQEPSHPPPSDQAGLSQPIFGGARSKNVLNQMPLSYMSSPWNPAAAAFSPRLHGNQGPAFITPVAHTTSNWPGRPRQASPWLARAQAPLKPSATIPKSWALPAAPHPPAQSNRLRLEGRVLVLLRGAPGSGKSTLARALLEHNPGGVALSTDNYFSRHGAYQYDPAALGEAHEWNHKQAVEAFERGANPIIIDNTNMQGWEMKPYVAQALKHGYKVLFKEPDTWWKNKPRELERRTAHNVPVEKIRRMLTYYERYVTVQSIMGSRAPERKPPSPLETSDSACPDLVGLPRVTEGGHRPGPQLCSSLPDVSSIGRSKVGMHEDGAYKSTESLNFQPSGNPLENPETDNMDLGELDAVLDLNRPVGDQRIPDCIVESVVSDEMPVAFSESIAQRVKRERPRGSSVSDRLEPADVVKDTKQSDAEAKETDQNREAERGEMVRDEGDRGMEFEGDWPCEASLEQRRARRREGNAQEEEGASAKANKTQPGPNVKEFQKLLDLIQTGVADIQVGSHSSSLSQSSREEEEEEGGSRSSSRSELPDCVLDWKDSFRVREHRPENEASSTAGATDTAVEAGVCGDERHGAEGEAAITPDDRTESSRETVAEADGSQACPSPVDAESGASQERKQRQGRRSGKQCKLALTFTQNCPQNTPNTAAQSTNNTEPDCDTRLGVKTNSELSTEPESLPLVDPGRSSQTDPQDFALLWRLNQPENRDDAGDAIVLSGDSSRFVPEVSSAVSAAVAVDPSGHREVPYHVLHEKGTQVEEKELGAGQDRLEDLRILSRHFKLVSFDTLEDLYEKCHHDLEWTTNLLLDSGERFFRADDEGELEEEDGAGALDELHPGGMLPGVEDTQESNFGAASQSDGSTNNTDVPCFGGANEAPDTTSQTSEPSGPPAADGAQQSDNRASGEDGAGSGSSDDGVIVEESRVEVEMEEEMASMDEANRLLQAELEEMEQNQKREERRSADLDIKSVELKLPTELALQLTELFGPVGVDPASCSTDDYAVQMDLNLAKLLHQKWKESLQEKQRQATLAFHLLQESSAPWGEQRSRSGSRERMQPSRFHGNADGSDAQLPFMDHWNVSRPHVSLRDIIKEEQAMQANVAKTRQSRADLDRRDGAALLKENQLYQLFPGIDRHFLQDIFRDHNYSLTQTELFLRSLLEEEPVKTVIAPETPRSDLRAASKDREKRQKAMEKAMECALPNYQDTEDPEYQDFRAEASQQRSRQLECFSKAAEAFKQGHKEVASFYAQQGHLHGQRMREANHRAAVQIFQRVNSSLLPRNILDLHGLHVDEALQHLAQVLQDKTTACEQGLCRPQLSVITGRGNHSQGGVARIRPAVIDYLTNKHYRFTEPKPGLVLVCLK